MKNVLITTIAAATFAMALPAFAQMAGGAMKSDNMGSMDSMSCQQMMDKGNTSMGTMADGSHKTMMMKEMGMAKTAMASSDEATCKMHMKKAMGSM
jgi:hypothetical protein